MDYSWNSYWQSWLKFFLQLPAFIPVAVWAHPNDTLMMAATTLTTALVAIGLYMLSQRKPMLFKIALVIVCICSIASALSAYSVFRA